MDLNLDIKLIKQKLSRKLNKEEIIFLEEALSKDLLSPDTIREKEILPSPEEQMLERIREQDDCKEIHIRPIKDNPFNNIDKTIISSKELNKKVIQYFKYTDIKRDGKLVGREGGVYKVEIVNEVIK